MLGVANANAVTSRMVPEQSTQRKMCPMTVTGDAICDFDLIPRQTLGFRKT
jgi:hypothetical protein